MQTKTPEHRTGPGCREKGPVRSNLGRPWIGKDLSHLLSDVPHSGMLTRNRMPCERDSGYLKRIRKRGDRKTSTQRARTRVTVTVVMLNRLIMIHGFSVIWRWMILCVFALVYFAMSP